MLIHPARAQDAREQARDGRRPVPVAGGVAAGGGVSPRAEWLRSTNYSSPIAAYTDALGSGQVDSSSSDSDDDRWDDEAWCGTVPPSLTATTQ